MSYIENNIYHINNIQQVPFNVHHELNLGIDFVIKNGHNANYLINLRNKLQKRGLHELSRQDLIYLIKKEAFTAKEISVLVICWGIYFTVMRGQSRKSILMLNTFLNKNNDDFFVAIKQYISNINYANISEVERLFKQFSFNGNFKIPGMDYGYFTKLFFFFSNENSLPILDKWLTISIAYLLENDSELTQEIRNEILLSIKNPNEDYGDINFRLNRRKPQFYYSYVHYLNNKTKAYGLSLDNLETFLFGWDLREDGNPNYINPRTVYKRYFKHL